MATQVFVWGSGVLGCAVKGKNKNMRRASPRSKRNTKTRIPRRITSLTSIKSVAVGCQDHCLALAKDGLVWSWGNGANGKLGHGDSLDVDQPKIIEGLYNVGAIGVGEMHSCALNQQGVLYTWGSSKAGQLGHGSIDMIMKPTSVKAFLQKKMFVVKLACGMNHTAVITAGQDDVDIILNGKGGAPNRLDIIQKSIDTIATSLWTWGWGEHGRLGINTDNLDEDTLVCCSPTETVDAAGRRRPCSA